MRTAAPGLLPIFRSRHQADLLSWLYLHPDQQFTLTDLAKITGTSPSTLHREVERLIDAGLISARPVGRSRLLSASTDHPASPALTDLLAVSYGPKVVVADEFTQLDGAVLVLIFGSWAARYDNRVGPVPHDVDVLVVGDVDRQAVFEAAGRAQERLGVPVNTVQRPLPRWQEASDGLVREIQDNPVVVVFDRVAAEAGQ